MSEDTRIIRFIDAKYAQDWVGTYSPIMQKGELSYNFRFGLLSDYRKSEGLEGDCEEATINLAGLGKSGICNDALLSCWSVWPVENGGDNPWDYFNYNLFNEKKLAIVSTVSKVTRVVESIYNILKELYSQKHLRFLCKADKVKYYDPVSGANLLQPNPMENFSFHIFNKRAHNLNGQKYSQEDEYRFALTIIPGNRLSSNGNYIHAKKIPRIDYKITTEGKMHYIDKIYHQGPLCKKINNSSKIININTCECTDIITTLNGSVIKIV